MWFKGTVQELLPVVGGKLLTGEVSTSLSGIGTDTREDLTGKLFVPFQGENFDAHDFLEKAEERGAAAALVHREDVDPGSFQKMAVIRVDHSLKAFQRLALWRRRSLNAKLIGITGSNGKTTTKEFAAALLSGHAPGYWSQKSFNNHWGVPISLLSIRPEDEWALIEMGMNHSGEITELCRMAEPDIVTVTFVGRSHLEGLGSIEGVARAKEEIYLASPPTAFRIFNLDNPHTREMKERRQREFPDEMIATFGNSVEAQVSFQLVELGLREMEFNGRIGDVIGRTRVPVTGEHHLTNLMAAASIALAVGMPPEKIWTQLENCRTSWGRGQWLSLESGAEVFFDAYNANPESMRAALQTLATSAPSGRKWAVLGEMKELGAATEFEHEELAKEVAQLGLAGVWFVGASGAAFERGWRTAGPKESLIISSTYEEGLAIKMASMLEPEDIVLVKGSRGIKLEQVVQAWGVDEAQSH